MELVLVCVLVGSLILNFIQTRQAEKKSQH